MSSTFVAICVAKLLQRESIFVNFSFFLYFFFVETIWNSNNIHELILSSEILQLEINECWAFKKDMCRLTNVQIANKQLTSLLNNNNHTNNNKTCCSTYMPTFCVCVCVHIFWTKQYPWALFPILFCEFMRKNNNHILYLYIYIYI